MPVAAAAVAAPISCPGVEEGVCRGPCQRATCQALEEFRVATWNASYSAWARSKGGWGVGRCLAGISSRDKPPSYCERFGVECCGAGDHRREECNRNAVTGIVLEVNFLNGSISDPLLLRAIEQLHACGLSKLILQGNDLSGTFSEVWGNFTQLKHLNLGECVVV